MCTINTDIPPYDHSHPFWDREWTSILTEVANPNCWKLDDPDWVKERKAKWKRIVKVIQSMEIIWSATDTKLYGEYYLTGSFRYWDGGAPGYEKCVHNKSPLLFLMFHPQQDEESLLALNQLYSRVTSKNKTALWYDRIDDHIHTAYQLCPEVLEAGMATYVRVLWGRDEAEYRQRDWEQVVFSGMLNAVFEQAVNPNIFDEVQYQYLIDYCFAHVDKFDWNKYGFNDYKRTQLATIAHYERIDPFRDVNPERHARAWQLVNHLRAKLNDPGCVDAELAARWAEAKNDAARFWDNGRLERDYPVLARLRYAHEELKPLSASDGLAGWYKDKRTLLSQLGQCVDTSAWKLNDSKWVAAREKLWKEVCAGFARRRPYGPELLTSGYGLDVYQDYFLRGELTGEGWNAAQLWQALRWDSQPFLLFHPDQSEANLKQQLGHFLSVISDGQDATFSKTFSHRLMIELIFDLKLPGLFKTKIKTLYNKVFKTIDG